MLAYVCQNLCKQLYEKIDVVDEERYDCEAKVMKHCSDVSIVRLYPAPNRHNMLLLQGKILMKCAMFYLYILSLILTIIQDS